MNTRDRDREWEIYIHIDRQTDKVEGANMGDNGDSEE